MSERRFRHWIYDHGESRSWNWHIRLGRVQVQLTVHHHGGGSSDRWVIQPHFVYDRKSRSDEWTDAEFATFIEATAGNA